MAHIINSSPSILTGLVDGRLVEGAYPGYFGQPATAGINHRHWDPEYAQEFGTDRVISSAARVAFDSAIRSGDIVAEWNEFQAFDIEVHDFNTETGAIAATFSLR